MYRLGQLSEEHDASWLEVHQLDKTNALEWYSAAARLGHRLGKGGHCHTFESL